jgi:lipoprotein-releasing system permease protein
MPYTYFIAKKYLWAKRKTGFISIIAYISITGVALGTAALIVTLSIISGFEKEMRSKFISFDSHIRIKTFEGTPLIDNQEDVERKIRMIPHVVGTSPYLEKEAMIRSKRATDGVIVKGIDQTVVDQVLNIRKDVIAYSDTLRIDLVKPVVIPDSAKTVSALPGALIGKKLANKLYLNIGDKITLFSLQRNLAFIQQPKVRQFRVTGIYRSGLAEYDNIFVYVDIREAQKLFDYGGSITGFEIKVDDLVNAEEVAHKMSNDFGYPYYVKTWYDIHRNLFGWLQTNNFIMMIIFSLIILVAAFNIIGTLFMIVIEKTKDIGILKSMGAGEKGIRNIFMCEGLLIGIFGASAGIAVAWTLCEVQSKFKILSLNSDVYFMDSVPIEMSWTYFVSIAAFAAALCVLATVFPSLKAAKLSAVDAIRYE